MRIVIVGAGALGRLFGAYFVQGGQEVVFVEPNQDVVTAINEKGIGVASHEVLVDESFQYYPARAVLNAAEIQQCDLLLLTVKSHHTRVATQQISHLVGPDSPLITLQNGLGHLEILEGVCDPAHIILGITYMSGTALDHGNVMNDGTGTTYLGSQSKNKTIHLSKICTLLNESGVPAEEVSDILIRKWNRV
ncbi:MAG: NAD-binding protein, partial [Desulfobulbaceae bacterium]|nr:NAD-binding protein [Candidatus Desulfatifera sulfidica]